MLSLMAQAVSRRTFTAKARVQSCAGPCETYGRRSVAVCFSSSTPASPVTTIPPMLHIHSFIYHPRCIMFFSQYSTSPVTTIPPMLHTHSFIYHRRCIMFFSQYSSFHCHYHSTNAPHSLIHLPPTLYNVFLPVLQFPLSLPFHQCSTLTHSSTTDAV
jgi:hypothetical protein